MEVEARRDFLPSMAAVSTRAHAIDNQDSLIDLRTSYFSPTFPLLARIALGSAHLRVPSRTLPDGYWAVPPLGRGMNSYPEVLRAWWPKIAEEYAAGMSGPKLAEKYGVGSTRTIYLILEKVRREQART
jgi:hypothetical protein